MPDQDIPTTDLLSILAQRLPSLHAGVMRVYGAEAYLFGVDLSQGQFNVLCDECGVGPYERNRPLYFDGVKILPNNTLQDGRINAVVAVPGSLIVRETNFAAPSNLHQRHR